jgi:glycosyltransferase involved in cell wall biosynthesis
MSKPRLHLVGLPHTQTTSAYLSCAYTQKVVKFCRMMESRYQVVLYAGEQNEAPCAEHVPLLSEQERAGWFGDGFDTVLTPLLWDSNQPYWKTMNDRAAAAIRERCEERDLLLLIAGWAQKPIADTVPLLAVEWGVGYEGIFSDYCAFESYAWMHHIYGRQGWATGRFFDAVIPNFFDPDEFHLADRKGDYLLFIGRLVERKGPHVAAMVAEQLGMPLVVAGPGALENRPGYLRAPEFELTGDIRYAGEAGVQERAELMAGARAVLAPTLYLEPFGGVAVEAQLSGTAAVTTDWGAFPETVPDEYRFRTLAEAATATKRALEADPAAIRQRALDRYSLDAVAPMYERWFGQLSSLWGDGWYAAVA